MCKEKKDKIWGITRIILNIIIALLLGCYFYKGKENYLEKIPVLAALITAMSLYFAVSIQALANIREFVETIKRHIVEGKSDILSKNEKGQETNILKEAIQTGNYLIFQIRTYLKGQIILIILVLVGAMVVGICDGHFDDIQIVVDIAHILNSAIILYAICYTLHITWRTADIVFIRYRQNFKEEMLYAEIMERKAKVMK